MKAKNIGYTLMLLGLFAMPAMAAGSLTGNWGLNGGAQPICSFTVEGNVLAGKCTGPGNRGNNEGPISGAVDGKAVKWTWGAKSASGASAVATFTGEWDLKDSVVGQVVRPPGPQAGMPLPFVAARLSALPETQVVTNNAGEKLDVVDWGGIGRPMLIIPGAGGFAISMSVLAAKFTNTHHVYSMTPVGDRENGTLAGDNVMAVMDALKLQKPVLVGHSMGCEELGSVGSRYPQRIAGLIYLDACLYKSVTTDQTKMAADKYPTIKAPILAIVGGPPQDAPAEQTVTFTEMIDAFQAKQPSAHIVRLPGASHFLWITNEADVVREMNAFLGALP